MYTIAPLSRSGSCLFSNAALIADRISAFERPAITILRRRKAIGNIERAAWGFRQSAPLTFGFQNSGQSNEAIQLLSARQTNPFLPSTVVSYPCRPSGVLSAPLLARLLDFAHVPHWPNLPSGAVFQGRMLRHELYRMIYVPRFKDANAADLFLGFRVWTVGGCDFAVFPIQGQRSFRALKRFSTNRMPVGAKMVVVFKACVVHGVSFALRHAIEFGFVVVAQTDVFHCSSPHSGLNGPAE